MRTTQHTARRWIVLGLASVAAAAVFFLMTGAPALAHAGYYSSIPAENAIVKTAPTQVSITFRQNLDPKGLSIVVYDNTAKVVSVGTAQIDPSNLASASVAMKGDGSDIYRVDWNTVSAIDGDPTLGAFVFAVSATGTSDKINGTTSAPASSSGFPAWLAAIIGLVVGAAGTFAAMRRLSAVTH